MGCPNPLKLFPAEKHCFGDDVGFHKKLHKVSIMQLSGEILELDVEPTARVQELQRRAHALHPSHLRTKLILSGQVLDPTSTLAESCVEDGALITFVCISGPLYVLTASRDSTAKLWSIESGACIQTFAGHAVTVCSAAFLEMAPLC